MTQDHWFTLQYTAEIPNDECEIAPPTLVEDSARQFRMLSASWEVQPALGVSFTPRHASPTTARTIVASETGGLAGQRNLELLNIVWAGEMPAEAQYRFSYVNYLRRFARVGNNVPNHTWYLSPFGFPSSAAGLPNSGTRAFSAISRAVFAEYRLIGPAPGRCENEDRHASGTTTVTADFGTRRVGFRMALAYDGSATPVATFDGNGTIANDGTIAGTMASTNGVFTGTFKGRFYGPTGSEIGLAYALDGAPQGTNPVVDQNLAGALIGN